MTEKRKFPTRIDIFFDKDRIVGYHSPQITKEEARGFALGLDKVNLDGRNYLREPSFGQMLENGEIRAEISYRIEHPEFATE